MVPSNEVQGMIKGQVISGDFSQVIIRQKSSQQLELGELLIVDCGSYKILFQIYDLLFASQISKQNLELISGMHLEEDVDMELFDKDLRYYTLAKLKNLLVIGKSKVSLSKSLPPIFATARELSREDLTFLTTPKNPFFLGYLRSGSKILDQKIFLDCNKVLSHHVLIPATTGRGKSNLTKCLLYDLVNQDNAGILVLDPHDEYFGRNSLGLKDHPKADDKVLYYTPKNPPNNAMTLKINLKCLKPSHFSSVMSWSDPQNEAIYAYYKRYNDLWIEALLLSRELPNFNEATLNVLKRRFMSILDITVHKDEAFESLECKSIFDNISGASTMTDVCSALEKAKTVIIDTSSFTSHTELLISNIFASEIFNHYKRYKFDGSLDSRPVISIVLEEAPRVIGKQVLESGPNVFSRIAKEGRKFKIGLFAITQLPSLIPKDILANMNTKIILGIEMSQERQAIIDSASQDLSTDQRNIASLDVGEAIISSNFAKFPIPISIPLFEDIVREGKKDSGSSITSKSYPGLKG